jgi:hypothetical protein
MRSLLKWALPVGAALLFVSGCRRASAPENPVTNMGLTETALGHALIEHAADFANSWLEPGSEIRFVPVWRASGPQSTNQAVRIYAISDVGAPANYMVSVPTHCRCVFIEPLAYETWLSNHVSHTDPTLEISEPRLLAFMLLHEAGHITHGDPGEFDGNETGSLNSNTTEEKARESSADSFAVEQLKGAMARSKDYTPWINAQFATADLSNLAFEMQQMRQERFFGAELLHTPEAFYDLGYTHPNFELRLLTVNDVISNTPTSHRLLESFLAKRATGTSILYQSPAAKR